MATTPIPARPPGEPPSPIQTAPNLVAFDPKLAVPSQPIYLQRNDYIGLFLMTNLVAVTVKFKYRWLTPQGEIKEGEFDSAPFGGVSFFTVPLYEGWLLSFSASLSSGVSPGFFCFLITAIFRNPLPGPGNTASAVIWQGYLYASSGNGWPGTPSKEITDGVGVLRSITGATPAAGADITETTPTQRKWSLLSFRAVLTASATVANRFPGFQIDDGVNPLFTIHTSVAQTAGQVISYTLAPSQPFFNDTQANVIIPLPGLILLKAGFRIRTITIGIQAGDQWTAPQYAVSEWGLWDV